MYSHRGNWGSTKARASLKLRLPRLSQRALPRASSLNLQCSLGLTFAKYAYFPVGLSHLFRQSFFLLHQLLLLLCESADRVREDTAPSSFSALSAFSVASFDVFFASQLGPAASAFARRLGSVWLGISALVDFFYFAAWLWSSALVGAGGGVRAGHGGGATGGVSGGITLTLFGL